MGQPCQQVFCLEWCGSDQCPVHLLQQGERYFERLTNWKRHDGVTSLLMITVLPWTEASGKMVGVIQTVRNVTAEQEAKSRSKNLERQLFQSQKLEAIGRLASGVAHDFNNLLAIILNYSRFVKNALEEESPILADVLEIHKAAMQAAQLTRQLLAFSRKEIVSPVVLELNRVVAEMDKMLRRMIGEDIEFRTILAPDLVRVRADAAQLEQVLINLVVNARDSMPQGGVLTIETSNLVVTPELAAQQLDLKPGPYVVMRVSDSGHGIDPALMEHIFEPFYTTKPPGQGTGLGLATVYGIAKQAGGCVMVESEVKKGSSFGVLLPSYDGPATAVTTEISNLGRDSIDGKTVLVVEDEDSVRKLTKRMLIGLGFHVMEAAGGTEALDLVREQEQPIDVLLTDVVMPNMSGKQLADQLKLVRPDIKVVFMSGYSNDIMGRHGIESSDLTILTKPFTKEQLNHVMLQTLLS